MCFFLSLVYCRLNRASLLIKAPSPLLHLSCSREEQRMREEERRRSCGQMDHVAAAASALRWSLTSQMHSNGRRHGNTDTWPQCEAWRWLTDTEAGLPVHLLFATISSLLDAQFLCYGPFSTGFVTSSGLRVASVPQPPKTCEPNIWSAHARIHPSHKSLIYFPAWRCECVCAHGWLQHCTEVAFRNLLNNSKSVTWKPYLRTSQVINYKKYIYWEINLFLQVNVFVKHQSKALLTVLSNSVSWRTCIHSQEYQRS